MTPDNAASSTLTASVAAVLIGAASGLRSQMGVAAVVLGTEADLLPRQLRSKAARTAVTLAALGELAADKYPKAPDRTAPPSLAVRLALGGLAGGLSTRARGLGPVQGAALGAAVAVAASFGGLALRRRLAQHVPALAAGLVEDAAAVGLAWLAVRPPKD